MSKVTINKLKKSYGNTDVIRDISIDISNGSFVVLVGPSGCGKSTLLRVLAGLEDLNSGQILIDDVEVNDIPPKDRDIAMVFQNYGLYPHMTVAENMGFALKLKKVDAKTIAHKVQGAAEILSLSVLLNRYPKQLSGGQRQRVAMGRAIVRDPKVFLFDEPLSNLDAKLRVQMRAEIKRLHQRLQVTTVYVTHDQIEAMTMADTIVAMHDGKVKQIGPPLDLYDKPQNLFVAGFIGSPAMNFFSAVTEHNHFKLDDGQVLKIPDGIQLEKGKRVVLGIRPEDLFLADGGLNVTIRLVEHTGAEIHVSATLGEQPLSVVIRQRIELKQQQHIQLACKEGGLHIFDPETEGRLN